MLKQVLILMVVMLITSFGFRSSVNYRIYVNKDGRDWWYLVLASDCQFYQMETWGDCSDTDNYYSKGQWKVENGFLELTHLDSIRSLPHRTITVKSSPLIQDTITVIVKGKTVIPPELYYVKFSRDKKEIQNPQFEYGNNGVIKIARKEFASFYMYRDMKNFNVNPSDTIMVFDSDTAADSITISFDWPIIGDGTTNYLAKQQKRYKIFGSKIYDLKGRLQYSLHDVELGR